MIGVDDYIIIRSVVDLSDEAKELLAKLKILQEKEVTLISVLEPYLNGKEYHTAMKKALLIFKRHIWKEKEDRVLMKQRKSEW